VGSLIVSTVNTLQQEAVIQLKKLIILGEIKLGERINEVELSNSLNMSRGPIRESLRILNQEGLVSYYPRRGMFVTELEKGDINEIYNIRCSLEKSAIELGFHLHNEETVSQLNTIVSEMRKSSQKNQKDTLVNLDLAFHETLVSLPGYNRLLKTWKSYNALIELIFAKVFELETESVHDISDSHEKLVKLLKNDNKELFMQSLEDHYMDAKEKLLIIW
jgi:DNA-binding GntR family transcriptional regulator